MGAVRLEDIQTQHHRLERKTATLLAALGEGAARDPLRAGLDDLVRCLQAHCYDEEVLMKRRGFDGLRQHESEHRGLLVQAYTLREKMYRSFDRDQRSSLLRFLELDLPAHMAEDRKAWRKVEPPRDSPHRGPRDARLGAVPG